MLTLSSIEVLLIDLKKILLLTYVVRKRNATDVLSFSTFFFSNYIFLLQVSNQLRSELAQKHKEVFINGPILAKTGR